jgi:hypothetical protein
MLVLSLLFIVPKSGALETGDRGRLITSRLITPTGQQSMIISKAIIYNGLSGEWS